jgi:hypothetical protein
MNYLICDEPELEAGDFCPYCARQLLLPYDILNCNICTRQGCSDCISAGACCVQNREDFEIAF